MCSTRARSPWFSGHRSEQSGGMGKSAAGHQLGGLRSADRTSSRNLRAARRPDQSQSGRSGKQPGQRCTRSPGPGRRGQVAASVRRGSGAVIGRPRLLNSIGRLRLPGFKRQAKPARVQVGADRTVCPVVSGRERIREIQIAGPCGCDMCGVRQRLRTIRAGIQLSRGPRPLDEGLRPDHRGPEVRGTAPDPRLG